MGGELLCDSDGIVLEAEDCMRRLRLKGILIAVVAVWAAVFTLPDGRLHVVICDVGQGDAILITRGTDQLLIDGGPNDRVIDCLGEYVPFYDRRIEVVVATHPQADHISGLIKVVQRYNVSQFVMGAEGNETAGYKDLRFKVQDSRINVRNVYSGDEIRLGDVKFKIVWPERNWVLAHLQEPELAGSQVLGAKTDGTDLNGFSIGGILSFGEFDVLLTGDADLKVEAKMVEAGGLKQVEVLKVPHHGSKTGMTKEWLGVVRPQLAVISVGKNNYGHPTAEAIKLLSDQGIKILRTDQVGSVEIVSDGIKWWVK